MEYTSVVFDANVYLGLSRSRIAVLRSRERRRGIVVVVSPWVVAELLAHLVSPDPRERSRYRSAVEKLWEHSKLWDHGPYVRLVAERQRLLPGQLFGRDSQRSPSTHSATLQRIAEATPDDPLDDLIPRAVEAHRYIEETENEFVVFITAATAGVENSNRREVIDAVHSRTFIIERARSIVRSVAEDCSVELDEPLLESRAEFVNQQYPIAMEMHQLLLERIIESGLDIAQKANLCWDTELSYVLPRDGALDHKPVVLVTGDRFIHDAASRVGMSDRVIRPEDYEEMLRLAVADE